MLLQHRTGAASATQPALGQPTSRDYALLTPPTSRNHAVHFTVEEDMRETTRIALALGLALAGAAGATTMFVVRPVPELAPAVKARSQLALTEAFLTALDGPASDATAPRIRAFIHLVALQAECWSAATDGAAISPPDEPRSLAQSLLRFGCGTGAERIVDSRLAALARSEPTSRWDDALLELCGTSTHTKRELREIFEKLVDSRSHDRFWATCEGQQRIAELVRSRRPLGLVWALTLEDASLTGTLHRAALAECMADPACWNELLVVPNRRSILRGPRQSAEIARRLSALVAARSKDLETEPLEASWFPHGVVRASIHYPEAGE